MNANCFWDIRVQGKEAEVDIFGVIGDLSFFEESTTATDFIRQLRGIGRSVTKLNVNLHSEGGSVWDGLAIYRALRDHHAEKVVHVSSLAASIATVIALAGDRIEVAPEATWMIHNPMAVAVGEAKDMQDAIARLNGAKENILNIYERRTGGKREELSDMMDAETWMYGEEIKAAGFADVVKADQPKMRLAAGPLTLAKHCPKCGKPKKVIDTKVRGDFRVRYLGCRECHCERDKVIVPIRYAPRRAY
jgi:ATP-dependent Clp protease protease subunit